MSANYPPPQQPPGQNPYAQQPPQGPPAPPQQPYAPSPYAAPPQGGAAPGGFNAPAPGGFNAAAYAPPAPIGAAPAGNPGLGVAAGIAAALIAAVIYGLLIKGTKHEIGYAALAVGAVVGFALAKVGGRNPALPFIGVPLALLGVYLGQLFGIALLISDISGAPGVVSLFTDHFSALQDTWKHAMDGKDYFFFAIAGIEGFVVTKRVAS
ncbi:hypothetical protein [Actinacidiphila paucisporea]|uniref:Uncharacterized protein n=1 Tax=Actinacidiphila paucisporea TaxID=310782 RepID=A0A1M6TZI9_9ACTN|nr:hypothetical protein [Actinacidiphila paucisporea]SHK62377.1 hypothetical protein SAMN05216499_101197 [Actinacidiphila paucisporea]